MKLLSSPLHGPEGDLGSGGNWPQTGPSPVPAPPSTSLDEDSEDGHWRAQYKHESYYDPAIPYEDYAPAFRSGYTARHQRNYHRFEDAEPGMKQAWNEAKHSANLSWDKAKHAARAAWDRVERALPGDSDRDGK